jgi:hypothetical protein
MSISAFSSLVLLRTTERQNLKEKDTDLILWQGYILETLPHVLKMGYTAVDSTFTVKNLKEKVWSRNKLKNSRNREYCGEN